MSPVVSKQIQRWAGILTIVALGVIFLGFHIAHLSGPKENLGSFLFGIFVPMVTAAAVVGGGLWLRLTDFSSSGVLRVGMWTVFMAFVFLGGQLLTILYQQAEGVQMSHNAYILVNGASAGGAVGFVVGLYDARRRRESRRSERLSSQLSVLNRVLRHDIRNGATVIQGRADLIEGQVDDPDHTNLIQEQASDLVTLGEHARAIEELQEHGADIREPFDVTGWIEDHLEELEAEYPEAEIATDFAENLQASAHPLIDTALANVIENGIVHSDKETPRLDISIESVDETGDEMVEIRVADNGPGIPDEEVEVLERGYETALDHMSGLGLWLVNWIVTASGGEVAFQERDPEGSMVSIRLEAARANTPPIPNLLTN